MAIKQIPLATQEEISSINSRLNTKAEQTEVDALQRELAIQKRINDAQWKIMEGQIADFEEVEESGASNPPSGAEFVSVEEVRGKTEQKTTQGLNLIPINATPVTITSAGVTYERFADGHLHIKGTATGTSFFVLNSRTGSTWVSGENNVFDGTKKYKCHPLPTGVVISTRALDGKYPLIISGSTQGSNDSWCDKPYDSIYVQVNRDTTVDTDIYPMIEYGTETHDYEPYTGGIPSPSPSYPQEIKSVESFTVKHTDDSGNVIAERTITPPRPLNRIGEYFDKADIENGLWKYETTKEDNPFNSGIWSSSTIGNNFRQYACNLRNDIKNSMDVVCDKFTAFLDINEREKKSGILKFNDNILRIVVLNSMGISNLEEFVRFYNELKPIYVLPLKEAETELIASADLEFLRILETLPSTDNIIITDQNGEDVPWLAEYIINLKGVNA